METTPLMTSKWFLNHVRFGPRNAVVSALAGPTTLLARLDQCLPVLRHHQAQKGLIRRHLLLEFHQVAVGIDRAPEHLQTLRYGPHRWPYGIPLLPALAARRQGADTPVCESLHQAVGRPLPRRLQTYGQIKPVIYPQISFELQPNDPKMQSGPRRKVPTPLAAAKG